MKNVMFVAGSLLVFAACTDSGKDCDSGELCDSGSETGEEGCGTYDGATFIGVDDALCAWPSTYNPTLAIQYDCDSASYWYDVYTVGLTGGADLYIYQTGSTTPWDEYHPLPSVDYDEDGWWDNLYLRLDITTDADLQTDGVSTLYECTSSRKSSLTWHLIVYDVSSAEADCRVWGHDPASLSTGCTEWYSPTALHFGEPRPAGPAGGAVVLWGPLRDRRGWSGGSATARLS